MKQSRKVVLAGVPLGAMALGVALTLLTLLAQGPASLTPWLLVAVMVGIPFLLARMAGGPQAG